MGFVDWAVCVFTPLPPWVLSTQLVMSEPAKRLCDFLSAFLAFLAPSWVLLEVLSLFLGGWSIFFDTITSPSFLYLRHIDLVTAVLAFFGGHCILHKECTLTRHCVILKGGRDSMRHYLSWPTSKHLRNLGCKN